MNLKGADVEGRKPHSDYVQLLAAMFVIGLILFYLCGLKEGAISSRYIVTFSPYLVILTTQSISIIAMKFPTLFRRGKALLVFTACLMVLVNVAAMNSRIKRCLKEDSPRVMTGQWIAKDISAGSVIADFVGSGGVAYFFDGCVWDYDLISLHGRDLELAKKARQRINIDVHEFYYKKPDYIVIMRAPSQFDYLGTVVYENNVFKVIKVENKREAFKGND